MLYIILFLWPTKNDNMDMCILSVQVFQKVNLWYTTSHY